ncbi:MAG: hypothetical protein ACXVFU_16680 [Nocardioidaceae bacterium]
MPRPRRRPVALLALAATALTASAAALPALAAGRPTPLPHVRATSPTGRYAEGASLVSGRLVSPAGTRTVLGNYPVGVVASPDGRTAVVADSGQGEGSPQQGDEALQVVDLRSGRVVQTVRDRIGTAPTFYNAGLAFSPDGRHLYATGGGNDTVYDYAVAGQRLRLLARWKSSAKAGAPTVAGGLAGGGVPSSAPEVGDVGAFSRGLALGPGGRSVLVTNEQGSTVAALSTTDGHLLWETPLGGAALAAGA